MTGSIRLNSGRITLIEIRGPISIGASGKGYNRVGGTYSFCLYVPRFYSAKTENTDWAAPVFWVVGALLIMRHCGSIVVLGSLACLSFSNGADNWFARRTELDGSQITKGPVLCV